MKAENTCKRTNSKKKVVNTLGIGGVLSIRSTQAEINIHEENKNHLMEKVLGRENLKQAFEGVKRNKGAPGIDGMKVEELQEYLKNNRSNDQRMLCSNGRRDSARRPPQPAACKHNAE